VTEGSFGLGRAIVEEFCKEGGKSLSTGISEAGLKTREAFQSLGYDTPFLRGDTSVLDGK